MAIQETIPQGRSLKRRMKKAVIFDIDGTLLDSVDLHAKAWQEAFQHFGHEIPFETMRSQIGKGGDHILPIFLSNEEQEKIGKELQDYRGKLFKERYLPEVKPFPGVRRLFLKIKSNGQQLGLASSAKGDELKTFERIAGIEDLVEAETSSADAKHSKPNPDIFEAALQKLGDEVDPKDCVVVGDSPHDAKGAKRAGLSCVGVLCGGFAKESLIEAGCAAIYSGPDDLLRRYDDSPLAKS